MECAQLGVDLNGGLLCSIALSLSLTRHAFCQAAAASFFERLALSNVCTRFKHVSERVDEAQIIYFL